MAKQSTKIIKDGAKKPVASAASPSVKSTKSKKELRNEKKKAPAVQEQQEEEEEEEEEELEQEQLEEDPISSESGSDNDDDDDDESPPPQDNLPTEDEYALLSGVDPSLILPGQKSTGSYTNKQRCLILASRGITSRHRHLLEDLRTLIPHHKKDSKLDEKSNIQSAVLEIASVKSCNSIILLEARKRQDIYLWAALAPNGPSAKFHLSNVHTLDELKLTGNALKSSRPLLNFSSEFTSVPYLSVIRELMIDVFGCPRGHPKSKPFIDRVMTFHLLDSKIWVRNYQISEEPASSAKEAREVNAENKRNGLDGVGNVESLIEIGPRFVLDPIRVFQGSFGGQTLFQNADYTSPNTVRAEKMRQKGKSYSSRVGAKKEGVERKEGMKVLGRENKKGGRGVGAGNEFIR